MTVHAASAVPAESKRDQLLAILLAMAMLVRAVGVVVLASLRAAFNVFTRR